MIRTRTSVSDWLRTLSTHSRQKSEHTYSMERSHRHGSSRASHGSFKGLESRAGGRYNSWGKELTP